MAVNYVKFQRGSQAAYDLLVKNGRIDDNTLYFIYPEDSSTVGKLYLGTRLISGGDIVLASATLAELSDVLVNSTKANSFLVQNADGKWDNMSLTDVATLIKANLGEIAAPANVFQVTKTDNDASDEAAIARAMQAANKTTADLNAGDSAIVKHLIYGDKYQYTAYVYDGTNWAAMDGNYSAENIYFADDIITTTAIGNISLSGGQAVIPAKGGNLLDLFNTLYVKEDNTDLVKKVNNVSQVPTAGLTGSTIYYEIGKTGTKEVTVSLSSDGEYKYGYSTNPTEPTEGQTVSSVKNDGSTGVAVDTSKTSPYTLTMDGTAVTAKTTGGATFVLAPAAKTAKGSVSTTGTVYHTQGGVPVSNLKKAYPAQRIAAGSKTKTVEQFRWYVPFYQGFTYDADVVANPSQITAAQLTALNAPADGTSKKAKVIDSDAYSATKLKTATASKAWRQYFLAYPKSYNYVMSGAKDGNNIDCTVSKANDVEIDFNGTKVTYTVYYINNAAAYDTLKISWNM